MDSGGPRTIVRTNHSLPRDMDDLQVVTTDIDEPPGEGSNSGLGTENRPFGINDLELVDQIVANWNPLISWLQLVGQLRKAV